MSITPEEIERLRGLREAVQTGPAEGAMRAAARLLHEMSASTVLGLLDEVERLRKDRETLRTAMKRVHKDTVTVEIEDIAHDALDATGDHSDGWGDCR